MYSRWEHWAGIKQLCPQKVVCCGLRERICFSWLLVQYFFGTSGNGERGNLWKWQRFCNHRKRYPIYKAYLQSNYKFVEYISWQPTPVSLSGESYGQRSLVGQSPWGRKESDMTEHTRVHTYPYNAYNKTAAKGFYYSSILSMKSIVQLSFYIIAIFVCGICHTCEISNLVFKLWWVIIYRHNTWIFRLLREVMESATALRFLFSEMHLFSFLFWVLWTGFRGCSRLTGTCMHAQLCLTFFDPMDWNPPGSSVYGIFQARILEWVAIFSSSWSSNPRIEPTSPTFSSVQSLSHVWLFVTPWTVAHQASLSITNFQSLCKLMSIESGMPSNHLILCHPLLLLPSTFPSIGVFSNESVLHIRWPKYQSFSFSMNIQDWFPLG